MTDGALALVNAHSWNLARYLDSIQGTPHCQALGIECAAAPTVCPCVRGHQCTLTRCNTVLADDTAYNLHAASLSGPQANSWAGVKPPTLPPPHACSCGSLFKSLYAVQNHVAQAWVGSAHDRAPECRPRLGIAFILSDASHPNPYRSVVAAGATRVPSRSWDYETSTSVEEQAVTPALAKLNEVAEDNDEAVLSSDSMGTLQTLIKVCMFANLTARRAVRTKEAGKLGAAAELVVKLSKRGIDLALAHEEACHNREKRGTTDFCTNSNSVTKSWL